MNEKSYLICHIVGLMGSVKEVLMRPRRRGLGQTIFSLLSDLDTESVKELPISSQVVLTLSIAQLFLFLPPPN